MPSGLTMMRLRPSANSELKLSKMLSQAISWSMALAYTEMPSGLSGSRLFAIFGLNSTNSGSADPV